jgi:hypothetical protein
MTVKSSNIIANVVFPRELWRKIQDEAKRRGLSAAAYVRETVLQRFEREEKLIEQEKD